MAARTPYPDARRRVEALIGVAAPFLDLVLLAGDRISRTVGAPDDVPLPAVRRGDRDREALARATPPGD